MRFAATTAQHFPFVRGSGRASPSRVLLIDCRPIDIMARQVSAVSQTDLERFGARVRAERERQGVSQEELADRAGIHRTYLGGVERGERNIGILNVLRIARALSVRPSALFKDFEGKRTR